MEDLTTTTGIVALAAAAIALIALLLAMVLAIRLRRLRAAQSAVLGDREARDLVTHSAELEQAFRLLGEHVDEMAARLDARLGEAEVRLDGAIAYRGLVRYDAYNELSGRQSTSIALLDARRSGVVISSIHHRDQARMYAKQVVGGKAELQLAPEEEEAVRLALEPPAAGDPA